MSVKCTHAYSHTHIWIYACIIHTHIILFFIFLAIHNFSNQGSNLCCLPWKHIVLTTGPPGNHGFTPHLHPVHLHRCFLASSNPSLNGPPSIDRRLSLHISPLIGFSSVQLLSCVRLFVTPWTVSHQASLSITNSWSLLKLMSIESVMPSSHLILCCPLLLLPQSFPA